MPSRTYQDRLIAGLLALGWTEVVSRSKYREFINPAKYPNSQRMFVGSSGALRTGQCASKSHSIGCPADSKHTDFYVRVLAAGDAQFAKPPTVPGYSF